MSDTLFNITSGIVTSNDYYTPKWLFEALNVEFDIDVAAPLHGIPWIPCKRWFSQLDDGLNQDWAGQFVWMNPPYGSPRLWVDKFIENNNGLALMVVSRSNWFRRLWEVSDGIMALPAEFKFVRPNNDFKTINFQSVVFALGDKALKTLQKSKISRVR